MQIIRGKYNGDAYQISFWVSLASFFILPMVLLIPFVILVVNKNPDYDIASIFSSYLGTGELELPTQFLAQTIIIEVVAKVLVITLLIGFLRRMFIYDAIKFKKNLGRNLLIILCGITAILLTTVILSFIYNLLGIEGDSSNQEVIEEMINSNMRPFMFVMVVFLAPIFEELIFRKFLIGYLTEKVNLHNHLAIAISSVSFALMHVIGDVNSFIFIFQYLSLSIIITLSYTISNKNIYVPIIVHLLNNLISFLLV